MDAAPGKEVYMTGLTIRADELIMVFEDYGTELQHFFDQQTGEVLTVFEDMDEEDEVVYVIGKMHPLRNGTNT